MKKFFNEHRDVLMLILRCAVAAALLIIAVVNYDKLTKIDMRALVAGAGSTAAAAASTNPKTTRFISLSSLKSRAADVPSTAAGAPLPDSSGNVP